MKPKSVMATIEDRRETLGSKDAELCVAPLRPKGIADVDDRVGEFVVTVIVPFKKRLT